MAINNFRVSSIFKIIIRICKKNLSFVGKRLSFYTKDVRFILCIFYLNEEELIQRLCLTKYIKNEISNSTSHKTKNKRKEKKHNTVSKSSFLETPEFL